jgi:hypothetical protein
VGLDAEPPRVKEVVRPDSWSGVSPLQVAIKDDTSGVNVSSLQVWGRHAGGAFDVAVSGWNGDVVELLPVDGSVVEAPYEVYLAVADHAGNGVEGFLFARLDIVHVHAGVGNVSLGVQGLNDDSPVGSPAPHFNGPSWGAQDPMKGVASVGSTGSASSKESSRWESFSWDDVPHQEKERSLAWYVVAAVGAVTLGTAVHQVSRRRRQRGGPKQDKEQRGSEKAPDAEDDGPTTTETDASDDADRPLSTDSGNLLHAPVVDPGKRLGDRPVPPGPWQSRAHHESVLRAASLQGPQTLVVEDPVEDHVDFEVVVQWPDHYAGEW